MILASQIYCCFNELTVITNDKGNQVSIYQQYIQSIVTIFPCNLKRKQTHIFYFLFFIYIHSDKMLRQGLAHSSLQAWECVGVRYTGWTYNNNHSHIIQMTMCPGKCFYSQYINVKITISSVAGLSLHTNTVQY